MSEVAAPESEAPTTPVDPASAAPDDVQALDPAAPEASEASTPEAVTTPETPAEPAERTLDHMYEDYMAGKPDQPRAEVEQVQRYLAEVQARLDSHEKVAQAFPTAAQEMRDAVIEAFGEESPETVRLTGKLNEKLTALQQQGEDIYLKPFIRDLYRFAQQEGLPRRILDFADPLQLGKALIEHGRQTPQGAVNKAEVAKQVASARDEGAKAERERILKMHPDLKLAEDGTGAPPGEGSPPKSALVTKSNVGSKSAKEIADLMSTEEGYKQLEQALKG